VSLHLRNVPTRVATGAYILHTGLSKWNGSEEQAKGVHATAAGAYPFLGSVWPTRAGTAISKDVWMLGIGVGLLADGSGGDTRA
jgi:hypothetical protein